MEMKIGMKIAHGGKEFVIVDIKHDEAMRGCCLHINAIDEENARLQQEQMIKQDQVAQGGLETIRRLLQQGGDLGLGFNIGGH